jgi:hypothetical protein
VIWAPPGCSVHLGHTVLNKRYLRELASLSSTLPNTEGHGDAAKGPVQRFAERYEVGLIDLYQTTTACCLDEDKLS